MVLSDFFVPQDPKKSEGVPSVFHKISIMEQKLWMKNGGLHVFRSIFFV